MSKPAAGPLLVRTSSETIFKKMKIAEDLFNFAYRVKCHQIKIAHPEWNAEQIHKKTLELIERGCA